MQTVGSMTRSNVKVKVKSPSKFGRFQKLSSPPFTWELAIDHGFLN